MAQGLRSIGCSGEASLRRGQSVDPGPERRAASALSGTDRRAPSDGESWCKGHVESDAWGELCDLGQVTRPLWALVSRLCKTEAKNRVRVGRIWADTGEA